MGCEVLSSLGLICAQKEPDGRNHLVPVRCTHLSHTA